MKPYGKFGLVIGLNSQIEETTTASVGLTATGREKLTGSASAGWFGACGIELKAGSETKLFAELSVINQTWAPEKDEWTLTGNNSSGYGVESGTTLYEDIVSFPVPTSPFFGVPLRALKQKLPFGSVGINIGASFSFGQKKK